MKKETRLIDLIKERRSTRNYSDRPVERQKIIDMTEAARFAPSASNGQPWRFFAVTSKDRLKEISQATGVINRWTRTAPCIMVACSKPGNATSNIGQMIKGIKYSFLDLGIAVEHMALAATELGLSTCWIGWFDEGKIKKALGISRDLKVVALLAVGYAADGLTARDKERLPLDKILIFK